jgi:hypothetical protein
VIGALALALLAACSDEPEPAPIVDPGPPPGPATALVARVESLSLGRTHDGFALAAFGFADAAGWRMPALVRAAGGVSVDGFLTYEFVAIPPETPVAAAEPARRLRADAMVSATELRAATGVRVVAQDNVIEAPFE